MEKNKVIMLGGGSDDVVKLLQRKKDGNLVDLVQIKKEEDKNVDFFLLKGWVNPHASSSVPKRHRPDRPPKVKCSLPECDVLTNKGYCCAEHSRKHDQLIRERKKSLNS